ncbi:exosome complex component 10 homolog [Bacillus rossius redtenbacheri]|uniref:exosome complex component 10 homolog n=1 Tax=Bacillus rossius redtenbacheri TaxID=93214 RepID=UPI002FDE6D29
MKGGLKKTLEMENFGNNNGLGQNSESSSTAAKSSDMNNDDTFLPGYPTIDDFIKAGTAALVQCTQLSNKLPSKDNWEYFCTYPAFQSALKKERGKILKVISKLLRSQKIQGNILQRDLEEQLDLIIDANDTILEHVANNLDEMDGHRRDPEVELVEAVIQPSASGSWNAARPAVSPAHVGATPTLLAPSPATPPAIRLLTAKNIERPQAKFKDKIDNSPQPFQPRIKDKPNASTPLALFLEASDGGENFNHPYEYELAHFVAPETQLTAVPLQGCRPLEDTPLVMVQRAHELADMLAELRAHSEIAVDLEHHSYRSFLGITCLMQISTREKDYIVDTLELRDKLHVLNEVFTKPSVVKVFHGADYDVEWLQRDLGLYVVNMFDTHQAARALSLPHLSLAYLLLKYCAVTADKKYQLADWRIRPLPKELVKYAREDTHYLLCIYDIMKNALIEAANGKSNILQSVIQCSTEICKKRYVKPVLTEDSHMDLYRHNKKLFDNQQMFALRELFRWRDRVAREEDESVGYVLPSHMLLQMAEKLPREMQGVLACCKPIPAHVRKNLVQLHQLILQARDQPLVKPILEEEIRARVAAPSLHKIDLDGPLHCPHDLSRQQDFRDDLPVLLGAAGGGPRDRGTAPRLAKPRPEITVFQSEAVTLEVRDGAGQLSPPKKKVKQLTFVCPYDRYKLVRPYTDAEKAKEAAEKAEAAKPASAKDSETASADDDERISRIHRHFMQVAEGVAPASQESPQSPEPWEEPAAAPPATIDCGIDTLRKQAKRKSEDDSVLQPRVSKQARLEGEGEGEEVAAEASPSKRRRKKKPKKDGEGEGPPAAGGDREQREFRPYDYGSVDYGAYSGGSKKHVAKNQQSQHRGVFRPRGKMKKFRGANRSMTFQNQRNW